MRKRSSSISLMSTAGAALAALYLYYAPAGTVAPPNGPADTGNPGEAGAAETSIFYARCDDARAAGAAPMRRGEPGYRPALDRDSDGIACEPYY